MKRLLVALAALVLLLVLVGFMLPSTYSVTRDGFVAAPQRDVFGRVADLETWPSWTAWSREADPTCAWQFTGSDASGRSTTMSWKGQEHGQGQLVFTNYESPDRLDFELTFIDGDTRMRSTGAFLFATESDGTRVTWTMEGELGSNPAVRWLGLFMDSMIGRDFEAGLTGLAASFADRR